MVFLPSYRDKKRTTKIWRAWVLGGESVPGPSLSCRGSIHPNYGLEGRPVGYSGIKERRGGQVSLLLRVMAQRGGFSRGPPIAILGRSDLSVVRKASTAPLQILLWGGDRFRDREGIGNYLEFSPNGSKKDLQSFSLEAKSRARFGVRGVWSPARVKSVAVPSARLFARRVERDCVVIDRS